MHWTQQSTPSPKSPKELWDSLVSVVTRKALSWFLSPICYWPSCVSPLISALENQLWGCFCAAWALNVSLYLEIFSNFTWCYFVRTVYLPFTLHNVAVATEQCESWSLSVTLSLCLSVSLSLSLSLSLALCLPFSPERALWFGALSFLLCCDEGRRILVLLVGGNSHF